MDKQRSIEEKSVRKIASRCESCRICLGKPHVVGASSHKGNASAPSHKRNAPAFFRAGNANASSRKGNTPLFVRRRGVVQAAATVLSNIHLPNFVQGNLYTGNLKYACVPGLNCYSCPGATGACPIGAFQAVVGSSKFSFSYYITGFIILIGVLLGRFVCGFLCPFGWFQDLLHKIPSKKLSTKRLAPLRYLKYVVLVVTVFALPVFATNALGMGDPFFCKWICPQGILEGAIPLSIASESTREALGSLFALKALVLMAVVTASIVFYRPFCKWICPLGALYSLFNRVSVLRYEVDARTCIGCGECSRVCKMDVDITKKPDHLECIRCGECVKACPTQSISLRWKLQNVPGRSLAPSKPAPPNERASAR